jgi:hypothetical protein
MSDPIEVISKPAPGQKAQKMELLQTYDCQVNVAKGAALPHIVPKFGVTAAEIALLVAQHGRGLDGVDKIEEGPAPVMQKPDGLSEGGGQKFKKVSLTFPVLAELPRLREKYGPKIVKHVFGAGLSAQVPRTIDDLKSMNIEPFVRQTDEKDA